MIDMPAFELLYNNKSATHDIALHLLDASYKDTLKGESDELDITLEDTERKWMDTWYPSEGATLNFKIGIDGDSVLDCGQFEIDEINITDSPNTVRIRALSAGINSPLRTVHYTAFDDVLLADVIGQVAAALGYTVEGKIYPLMIERVTQSETDLAFIYRLAKQYGYIVKVKGKRLIFSRLDQLKTNSSVITLHRHQIDRGWEFRDQIRTVKKEAVVARQNPKSKRLVKSQSKSKGKTSADKSVSRGQASTASVANARADANLTQDNDSKAIGRLSSAGNTLLVAGANFDLVGFARFDGKCLINTATHTISRRGGYSTGIEFIRLSA